jgi:hypothetical protein
MFVILMKQRHGEITHETPIYSRSLFNYILFNLSIEIVVLSRVSKRSLVFAEAQASIFKRYFKKPKSLGHFVYDYC